MAADPPGEQTSVRAGDGHDRPLVCSSPNPSRHSSATSRSTGVSSGRGSEASSFASSYRRTQQRQRQHHRRADSGYSGNSGYNGSGRHSRSRGSSIGRRRARSMSRPRRPPTPPPGPIRTRQQADDYDDGYNNGSREEYDDEYDRPLVCSNPSSYASRSRSNSRPRSRGETSNLERARSALRPREEDNIRARSLSRPRTNAADDPLRGSGVSALTDATWLTERTRSPAEGISRDMNSGMSRTPGDAGYTGDALYGRMGSTLTGRAAFFDEHHRDPVESVAGAPPSPYAGAYAGRRPPSSDQAYTPRPGVTPPPVPTLYTPCPSGMNNHPDTPYSPYNHPGFSGERSPYQSSAPRRSPTCPASGGAPGRSPVPQFSNEMSMPVYSNGVPPPMPPRGQMSGYDPSPGTPRLEQISGYSAEEVVRRVLEESSDDCVVRHVLGEQRYQHRSRKEVSGHSGATTDVMTADQDSIDGADDFDDDDDDDICEENYRRPSRQPYMTRTAPQPRRETIREEQERRHRSLSRGRQSGDASRGRGRGLEPEEVTGQSAKDEPECNPAARKHTKESHSRSQPVDQRRDRSVGRRRDPSRSKERRPDPSRSAERGREPCRSNERRRDPSRERMRDRSGSRGRRRDCSRSTERRRNRSRSVGVRDRSRLERGNARSSSRERRHRSNSRGRQMQTENRLVLAEPSLKCGDHKRTPSEASSKYASSRSRGRRHRSNSRGRQMQTENQLAIAKPSPKRGDHKRTPSETSSKYASSRSRERRRHRSQSRGRHVRTGKPQPSPKHDNCEHSSDSSSKYNGCRHCFITIEEQHRFLMLYTFLKRHTHCKVIVFFSTTKSVQYHGRLLERLKFDVTAIHSGMNRERFTEKFVNFSRDERGGILCMPDFQGDDVAVPPTTRWLVQYEPSADPSDYIFRVGRIGAESSERGGKPPRALLFLTPSQFGFLEYYKTARVPIFEYEVPKIANVQNDLIKLIRQDAKLRAFGIDAYHAYITAYSKHEYTDVYSSRDLDARKAASCFGFERPPSEVGEGEDKPEEGGRVSGLQAAVNSREKNRWKPKAEGKTNWKPTKTERTSWMTREKSWKFSDVHADKMRRRKDANPADLPKTVKMR